MSHQEILQPSMWDSHIYTSGGWKKVSVKADVINKAQGTGMCTTGVAQEADVVQAARDAAAAQAQWAAMAPRERADILRTAGDLLKRDFNALVQFIAQETGGIIAKAQLEVNEAATLCYLASGQVLTADGNLLPSTPGRINMAKRMPMGVVGVISPFNFPLVLSMRSVAPALAAGNAVILKPDPQTTVSGGYIIARVFQEAGLPDGVLHVLPGGPDVGNALVNAPEVRMIHFTGSTAVGRLIGEQCGKQLKKVSLELGGKSPLIVLEDADPDRAASNIAFGAWLHQGQICMASGRILLHEKIAPAIIERLIQKATHLPVGDPTGPVAIGPMINARQVAKAQAIVDDSIKAGAKLEAGGTHEGLFFKPTVLSGLKPGMRAFDEEIFAPVVNITTFSSDDEAVALANQTEYGLSSAVISPNLARAMAIGERINAGMLHINDQTVADECTNPFGGTGCSGNGTRVGGPANLEDFTQWKWVTIKAEPPLYPF